MAAAELRLSLPEEAARDAVAAALSEQGFDASRTPTALVVSSGSAGTPDGFEVHLSAVPEGTLAVFDSTAAPGGGAAAREAARLVGARLAQQGLLAFAAPAAGALPPIPAAPSSSGSATAAVAGYPGAPATTGYATALAERPAAPDAVASGHTNVTAIVAIVLGFIVPLAGVVTGAIALSQIKRTGEKGHGLAIGGIVAGSVLTVVSAGLVVAGLGLGLFAAGSGAVADPYAPPEEGGVSVAPDEQAPFDPSGLVVGACLDELAGGFVTSDNIVDCAQPHSYEAFGGFDVAGGDYPGDAAIESAALDGCEAAFTGYVGASYQDSRLDYYYVGPTQQTWEVGDREIFCLLYDPEAVETTGSLAGSGL
ncbi:MULTISPECIES: DUF4190 domain-containing protein [Microbacterium]|uniref:DUF4190 domain-containing protein n=1 Tax=Microbacterium TaxID=33882 RepID=UPI0027883736|nr:MULTISPECIES: DUF4190 domain-containing protein [Microbacterium]MDQ1082519.1 hypothetical protein [Microbacterium sp. SORGH_AS_0344]MDQ1168709.1 hypothetical protein [Microbacterium proteolyticum]